MGTDIGIEGGGWIVDGGWQQGQERVGGAPLFTSGGAGNCGGAEKSAHENPPLVLSHSRNPAKT